MEKDQVNVLYPYGTMLVHWCFYYKLQYRHIEPEHRDKNSVANCLCASDRPYKYKIRTQMLGL